MSGLSLRPPDLVMRLDRLGASHPTRLSFLRAMMRRAFDESWRVERVAWMIDAAGFGHAVTAVKTPRRTYSLVAFSTPLADAARTDRVIAEAWDTSFVLYDGVPDAAEIARLRINTPLQEAGRFTDRDLILSRANKSVRLFAYVVDRLAEGRQPDTDVLDSVGYLMRTTAVYGNGKFGTADRDRIARRPEFAGPFRAEMLTVWLIRSFTIGLAEHIAGMRAPARAAALDPDLRRRLGVGNATGLGMAPFLVRHPLLMHRWFLARETALARVRALDSAGAPACAAFCAALAAMRENVRRWKTGDETQVAETAGLDRDLLALEENALSILRGGSRPWDALYVYAEQHFTLEGQEAAVALMLDPHGDLIDDLADAMAADEAADTQIDGRMDCGGLRAVTARLYQWTEAYDFETPGANARFWYVSQEKLEPRLGERGAEPGAELELPLAIARDVTRLIGALDAQSGDTLVAAFLQEQPEWRQLVRRIQLCAQNPYAEIRGNLIDARMRPIDLLRCKLAFFGASRFDPRSDRWLRISLFAGEPLPEEIPVRTSAGAAS